jgi:hypothetical protein
MAQFFYNFIEKGLNDALDRNALGLGAFRNPVNQFFLRDCRHRIPHMKEKSDVETRFEPRSVRCCPTSIVPGLSNSNLRTTITLIAGKRPSGDLACDFTNNPQA